MFVTGINSCNNTVFLWQRHMFNTWRTFGWIYFARIVVMHLYRCTILQTHIAYCVVYIRFGNQFAHPSLPIVHLCMRSRTLIVVIIAKHERCVLKNIIAQNMIPTQSTCGVVPFYLFAFGNLPVLKIVATSIKRCVQTILIVDS